jgi:hypothetical protein
MKEKVSKKSCERLTVSIDCKDRDQKEGKWRDSRLVVQSWKRCSTWEVQCTLDSLYKETRKGNRGREEVQTSEREVSWRNERWFFASLKKRGERRRLFFRTICKRHHEDDDESRVGVGAEVAIKYFTDTTSKVYRLSSLSQEYKQSFLRPKEQHKRRTWERRLFWSFEQQVLLSYLLHLFFAPISSSWVASLFLLFLPS